VKRERDNSLNTGRPLDAIARAGEERFRKMIKVLIADDHKMFRQGLRMLFEMEPDIKIVGEARDGLEVQELATQLDPDVILMDINMPGADGVEATRQILTRQPNLAIIILTMFREDEHVFQAIRAGARGYVLKDADSVEVTRAIRTVASGSSVLDPAMTAKVFNQFKLLAEMSEKSNREGLTDRELEILSLIAQGASNREIGEKLFLSEKTIKNYVTSIFQKLQTNDRTQAAVYALQHGLITKGNS
jgi:DNA-binding NarL/FixJ family response regulator